MYIEEEIHWNSVDSTVANEDIISLKIVILLCLQYLDHDLELFINVCMNECPRHGIYFQKEVSGVKNSNYKNAEEMMPHCQNP